MEAATSRNVVLELLGMVRECVNGEAHKMKMMKKNWPIEVEVRKKRRKGGDLDVCEDWETLGFYFPRKGRDTVIHVKITGADNNDG